MNKNKANPFSLFDNEIEGIFDSNPQSFITNKTQIESKIKKRKIIHKPTYGRGANHP